MAAQLSHDRISTGFTIGLYGMADITYTFSFNSMFDA